MTMYRQRFQGKTSMQDVDVTGDFTVAGAFTFGDASMDTLILKGRVSTMTSAGAAVPIDATYTFSELWEIKARVTSYTGTGATWNAYYMRSENYVAGAGKSHHTLQLYAADYGYGVGDFEVLQADMLLKTGAATYGYAATAEFAFSPESGSGAITITNHAETLRLCPSTVTGRMDAPNCAKVHGIYLLARDGDGGSTKLGDGFYMGNDSSQSGTRTLTNGINIAIGATVGLKITGLCTTGIQVGTTTTAGITVSGATTNAVYVSGTSTTASSRTFKGILTVNNANYGDGYGAMESELTLTGTVAGTTSALSSWVNMITANATGEYILAQSNGLYCEAGATLTNGIFIFGMGMDCLLTPNGGAGGATFYPFKCVNAVNVTSAIFLCNDATSDLGEVGSISEGATSYVPLFSDNKGKRYVKVYKGP